MSYLQGPFLVSLSALEHHPSSKSVLLTSFAAFLSTAQLPLSTNRSRFELCTGLVFFVIFGLVVAKVSCSGFVLTPATERFNSPEEYQTPNAKHKHNSVSGSFPPTHSFAFPLQTQNNKHTTTIIIK